MTAGVFKYQMMHAMFFNIEVMFCCENVVNSQILCFITSMLSVPRFMPSYLLCQTKIIRISFIFEGEEKIWKSHPGNVLA